MNDNEIIEMLMNKDQKALHIIYNLYKEEGIQTAYFYLRDFSSPKHEAEEVFVDATKRLWFNPPQKPIKNLKSYLFTIIRNLAKDRIKKISAQKCPDNKTVYLEDYEIVDPTFFVKNIEQKEKLSLVYEYMENESYINKMIFNSIVFNGLTISQVARLLGYSNQTISNHLKQLRERIKNYIKKRGGYNE